MFCINNSYMGLLDIFKKSDSSKEETMSEEEKILNEGETSGTIIPNHIKKLKERLTKKVVSENTFLVTGVYAIGTQVMISGKVKSGLLKKKLKTKINDKESILTDLKKKSSSVKQLIEGEEGAIFLKGKNLFLVKIGDILDFK